MANEKRRDLSKNMKLEIPQLPVLPELPPIIQKGLNLTALQKELQQGIERVRGGAKKDIVMVVGNTGAGKSTTINYLLGHELIKFDFRGDCHYDLKRNLKKVGDDYEPLHEEDQPKEALDAAGIGHTTNSKTLFPTVYASNSSLSYCDFPGFGDTREKELRVAISLVTEMAIKSAQSIKGIFVVIDFPSMGAERGKSMKNLSDILSRLIKNISDVKQSIHFVFTKVPADKKQKDVISKLKGFLEDAQQDARKKAERVNPIFKNEDSELPQTEKEELELLEKKIGILELMVSGSQNIIIANLDTSEFREIVKKSLEQPTTIPSSSFNFGTYEPARMDFTSLMIDIATQGQRNMAAKINLSHEIERNIVDLENLEGSIEANNFSIANIGKIINEDDRKIRIEKLNKTIEILEEQIKNKNLRIDEIIRSLKGDPNTKENDEIRKGLLTTLEQLDTDEQVEVWKSSIRERRFAIAFLSYTKKEFKYHGEPFDKVCLSMKNGSWYNSKGKKITETAAKDLGSNDSGEYSVTYKSNKGKDGVASIILTVEKRKKAGNKEKIQRLKEDINTHQLELNTLNSKIAELNTLISSAKKELSEIEKNTTLSKSQEEVRRNELNDLNKSLNRQKEVLELKIPEGKKKLADVEKIIAADKASYLITADVARLANMEEPIIQDFINTLDRLNKFEKNLLAENADNDISKEFYCPINNTIMTDPVILDGSGHSFERNAIYRYLEFQKEQHQPLLCPVTKKPVTGSFTDNFRLREQIQKSKCGVKSSINHSVFWSLTQEKGNTTSPEETNLELNTIVEKLKELSMHKAELKTQLETIQHKLIQLESEESTLQGMQKKLALLNDSNQVEKPNVTEASSLR